MSGEWVKKPWSNVELDDILVFCSSCGTYFDVPEYME